MASKRLEEILVGHGLVDAPTWSEVTAEAATEGVPVILALAKRGLDPSSIVWTLEGEGLPVATELLLNDLPERVLAMVPAELARSSHILPVMDEPGLLFVAAADPFDEPSLGAVADASHRRVRAMAVDPILLEQALQRYYPSLGPAPGIAEDRVEETKSELEDFEDIDAEIAELFRDEAKPVIILTRKKKDVEAEERSAAIPLVEARPRVEDPPFRAEHGLLGSRDEPKYSVVGPTEAASSEWSQTETKPSTGKPEAAPPWLAPPDPSEEVAGHEPAPEPQQAAPAPEPQQAAPAPEPQQAAPAPEPQQATPAPEKRAPSAEEVSAWSRTAITRMEKAHDRDAITSAALSYLGLVFERAAVLKVSSGQISGWVSTGTTYRDAIDSLELPLDTPSTFALVVRQREPRIGPLEILPGDGAVCSLLTPPPSEAAVVPVTVANRVVCLIYGDHGSSLQAEPSGESLETIAKSMGDAFEGLIRSRKQA